MAFHGDLGHSPLISILASLSLKSSHLMHNLALCCRALIKTAVI